MSQVTLRTNRLLLVPLADEHLQNEIELDADPEVMRFLGAGRPRTPDEVEGLHRERLAAADVVRGLGFWAGLAEGQFVGWWLLEPPERSHQEPVEGQGELGYRLLRRHWREGLASEGARELIRYGFEDVGLSRIFAETMAINEASRATMTSVGMQHVRTFRAMGDESPPGSELGHVGYEISREKWVGGDEQPRHHAVNQRDARRRRDAGR